MTDNEIIKALEYSPLDDIGGCRKIDVLDLINRQKAEIERLKEAYAVYEETTGLKWARAEAIKEFAKRLKKKASGGFWYEHTYVDVEDIDNLVKEMTEEGDNDA